LAPHENHTTDIILLGHSMGGLLSADVALLLRHHIIGTVNFDTPFLGMHPGIVKAGLQSIFKPWPGPEGASEDGKRPSRMDTLFNPKPTDPNYNPSFANDVHIPMRKGWENAFHFVSKHSNALISASKSYVTSHLEFGGAMADYRGLKERYARIRALEEDDEEKRRAATNEFTHPPRIRFVNYYTASTGRPKKPKSPKSPKSPLSRPASSVMGGQHDSTNHLTSESLISLNPIEPRPEVPSPRISVEEHRGDQIIPKSPEEPLSANSEHISFGGVPSPVDSHVAHDTPTQQNDLSTQLPDIPPVPKEPPFVDPSRYTDKSQLKAAQNEHSKALKEYKRAVRHRNSAIKEHAKMQEKLEKQALKSRSKERALTPTSSQASQASSDGDSFHSVEEGIGALDIGTNRSDTQEIGVTGQTHHQPSNHPYSHYNFSRTNILSAPNPDDRISLSDAGSTFSAQSPISDGAELTPTSSRLSTTSPPKKQRFKKFCMLPPADARGNKDPTWVRIFMKDMDEVGAHCGLFFMSDTYERLVGDVGGRIEEWVRETEDMRVARELQDLG
jgi:hypothetical protein